MNATGDSPALLLTEEIIIDDPDDNQLPLATRNRRSVPRFIDNEDGEEVANDISGEHQLVQDVAALVWT